MNAMEIRRRGVQHVGTDGQPLAWYVFWQHVIDAGCQYKVWVLQLFRGGQQQCVLCFFVQEWVFANPGEIDSRKHLLF